MRHQWKLEADGSRAYLEMGYPHGGPLCLVCYEYFCEHERDFDEDAECPGLDAEGAATND